MIVIFSGMFFFSRVLITRQQLVMAARYGTDMILYTKLSESQIKQEIRNYLSDPNLRGRKLDPAVLTDQNIVVVMRDTEFVVPSFSLYDSAMHLPQLVRNIYRMFDGISRPYDKTSYVEIYYPFDFPGIFSVWGTYLPMTNLPTSITVSGRSEVLAGTGCKGSNHRH
jgi:hypothetical protein